LCFALLFRERSSFQLLLQNALRRLSIDVADELARPRSDWYYTFVWWRDHAPKALELQTLISLIFADVQFGKGQNSVRLRTCLWEIRDSLGVVLSTDGIWKRRAGIVTGVSTLIFTAVVAPLASAH
jgi:hypothetical protein